MINGAPKTNIASLLRRASPEASVAMLAIDDAHKARKAAKQGRKQAQLDRLTLMKQSANKVREMAKKALYSSIYQGVIGSIRAGAGIAGDLSKSSVCKGVDRGLKPLQSVDPFALESKNLEVQKQRLEISAEAASHRESAAADEVSRSSQLQASLNNTLKQINAAGQGADLEASRL